MPRSELNNPTERIGRLLAEIAEIESWIDQLIPLLTQEQLDKVEPFPSIYEIEKERLRRSLSLRSTLSTRLSQRRSRDRTAQGIHLRGRTVLTEEKKAEILRLIEKEDED